MNTQPNAVPDVGRGKRGVDGHIGYLLRQAHSAHRARMERALAADGVTLPQFSVLVMLAAYPGASGAELARLSMLTPQTMNVILSNLERDGAIARRAHAEHGRIQVNEITSAGRNLLSRCKRAVKVVEERLLAGLSPLEEQAVRKWLVMAAQEPASDGLERN
ncbi:MarR family transcriptional regulator [Rhodoferax sp. GW822-FHT02A01]|uniref:MarR family winged helix-turn-helix transcriptional regulator n=1 Tax=Rhodoferax sp. GW822-FHT02A01 TaxID=3141537 RepID=UPI00315DEDA0